MTIKGVTAVLFDWDFTLAYAISPNIQENEKLAILFQNHGIACTKEQVSAALKSLQEDISKGIVTGKLHPQKRSDIVHKYRKLLNRLNHFDTSYEFAYEVYSGYARLPHFLFPEVRQTLEQLKRCGIKMGVLSNHSCSARPVIEQFLIGFIPPASIMVSEELGIHKPAKSIFQKAAARIKTPAEQIVYVGDNLAVDAIGSVNAGEYGMGIWVDRKGTGADAEIPENVVRITTLAELGEMFCAEREVA
ncbi:MAG: HAD family hydrolase [Chloroflexota bacterium]